MIDQRKMPFRWPKEAEEFGPGEVIGDPLYDILQVGRFEDGGVVEFFNRRQRCTMEQSNVHGLGELPGGVWFLATGFQLVAYGHEKDIARMRQRGGFSFRVAAKEYAAIAPLDRLFSRNGVYQNNRAPYQIVPVFIGPETQFRAFANIDPADVIEGPLTLALYMQGWRRRLAQ